MTERHQIYLEPLWKLPRSYDYLTQHPPDRYRFVEAGTPQERIFGVLGTRAVTYVVLNALAQRLPIALAKSAAQRWSPPPSGTALTYAHHHLVFRPEPWIVEVEYAALLVGHPSSLLRRYRGIVERSLASPWCRGVRAWCRAGADTILNGLDSRPFAHKVRVIHHAVPPRAFTKEVRHGPPRLLFVGSGNMKGVFEVKGGRDLLAAFARVRSQRSDASLVIRSDMSNELRREAARIGGVRVLSGALSNEAMEQEFRRADMLVLPSYNTPPFTILDAMAYELPVITIDAFANHEYVEDGRTGLVAPKRRINDRGGRTGRPFFHTRRFFSAISRVDARAADEIAARIIRLINDAELRRRLGRAGRWEVEHGRFSIARRNEQLQRMFDQALELQPPPADD